MSAVSKSALKVPYDLRPAKQAERRMLIDAFQRLTEAGFPIRDYQYTGFGALYFIDFILFHKILGIDKMLSIEHDISLESRVRFNCPYNCVDIAMNSAGDIIPTLAPDRLHILWLDYDYPVSRSITSDLYLASSQLSRSSILLVTVDVEPPATDSEEPAASKAYFEEEAGDLLGVRTTNDFIKSNLPRISMEVLKASIKEGMAGRPDMDFFPLFHFLYADGHRMLTIGGVLGSQIEKRKLKSIDMRSAFYMRTDLSSEPYEIIVPKLTRKERHILDSAMPCESDWLPEEFNIPQEWVMTYREVYRFLPAYAELLL